MTMMTLTDLFDVMWDITMVNITARDADMKFLHEWIYGDEIHTSVHMDYEQEQGRLTIENVKINSHGDRKKNGTSEIGYSVKADLIPELLRNAPITHLMVMHFGMERCEAVADVELSALEVEVLLNDSQRNQ